MNKLKWWFRIVGGFYFLLGVVWSPVVGVNSLAQQMFPNYDAPLGGVTDKFLYNVGAMLGFEWMVMGAYMLYASRNPSRHFSIVWLVIGYEILRGIVDDLFLIAQGYPAVPYVVWIIIHLSIIATAILFTREASAQTSAQTSAPLRA
jgi:hypothetical protein